MVEGFLYVFLADVFAERAAALLLAEVIAVMRVAPFGEGRGHRMTTLPAGGKAAQEEVFGRGFPHRGLGRAG
nr:MULTISPECIES: hypothetical protein [Filomicrobium]